MIKEWQWRKLEEGRIKINEYWTWIQDWGSSTVTSATRSRVEVGPLLTSLPQPDTNPVLKQSEKGVH